MGLGLEKSGRNIGSITKNKGVPILPTDVNGKSSKDSDKITDDRGRSYIRRTFDAHFVVKEIRIVYGVRRQEAA